MVRADVEGKRDAAIAVVETEMTTFVRLLEHLSRHAAAYRDMSRADYHLACAISSESPISIAALAAKLRLDPATVTRRVGSMDARGYITRSSNEEDRRKSMIELSEAGREHMESTRAIRRQRDQMLIGEWDIDDQKRLGELMHLFNRSISQYQPLDPAVAAPVSAMTSSEVVATEVTEGVVVARIDDGKANAFTRTIAAGLIAALDAAERDDAAICLLGRANSFCAGYDRNALQAADSKNLLADGREVLHRLSNFGRPVVVGIEGSAVGFGAAIVLTADYRLAAEGSYKIGFPESRLGLRISSATLELALTRLLPSVLRRALLGGELFEPAQAASAGFVDEVVDAATLADAARRKAKSLAEIPAKAYRANKATLRKLAVRESTQ